MPETLIHDFEADTVAALLEDEGTERARRRSSINLFWRTFFMLALLLLGSIVAWLQTLRALEYEPRAVQTAHQIVSQINLSRAALINADAIARVTLIKTMAQEEGLHIVPREKTDVPIAVTGDVLDVAKELRDHLGPSTIVAKEVNGNKGLWVSFEMDGDPYWYLSDLERFVPPAGKTWIIWLLVATALSLTGAALIARLINKPLAALSFAASRVREGNFQASRLDESVHTSEIREVNIGFNRMAQRLAKLDQDRALMLAGISHDLRTPLARLRLETELSVTDPDAKQHMAADIAQLDAVIGKFLDYARPDEVDLVPISLQALLESCIFPLRDKPDVRIQLHLDPDLAILGDEVELGRVFTNLLENSRKYGKTADTGIADIEITAIARGKWVYVKVRDHGLGVAADQIANLMQPFYRGEAARTAANGAGLGLAIVEKTVRRMGGAFSLNNSSTGGLSANLKLQHANPT